MIIIFGFIFMAVLFVIIKGGQGYTGPVCKHCEAPVYYRRDKWVHTNEFPVGHKAVPYLRIEK